ncbi:unnamed protein product [Cladocopium goreaui]|uniref:2OG-Fe(II) oxygenase n=1 Tax=Cladocopium goreaui TaxID=2562237 RepID=A0A9P1DNW3_9DINO|nr:unnamed protein product [Cladocopium goreaui]
MAGAFLLEEMICPEEAESLRNFLSDCPLPVAPADALTASYWASPELPGNPVDELIGRLRRAPGLADLLPDSAGAEWWWQDTDNTDPPKVFHTDCNLVLPLGSDVALKSHPEWSSVMYLTDLGGATAIFHQNEVLAVWPRIGRYLLFPGAHLHCVLFPEEPPSGDRMTLLINWWTQKPHGCSPSPRIAEIAEIAPPATAPATAPASLVPPRRVLAMQREQSFEDHVEEWRAQRVPRELLSAKKDHVLAVSYLSAPPEDWWS